MIQLTKGQNVRLTGVEEAGVGLSWDPIDDGREWDLDVLAIELDSKDGKCLGDPYAVFYNSIHKTSDGKPTDPTGAVIHTGDSKNGRGAGDDEALSVVFSKLDPRCNAIIFIVNIYEGKERNQNFGQVKNPKARLYYSSKDVADIVYELDEDFSSEICMEFCMLYKHNDEWKFKALGDANKNSLAEELNKWGLPCNGNA